MESDKKRRTEMEHGRSRSSINEDKKRRKSETEGKYNADEGGEEE